MHIDSPSRLFSLLSIILLFLTSSSSWATPFPQAQPKISSINLSDHASSSSSSNNNGPVYPATAHHPDDTSSKPPADPSISRRESRNSVSHAWPAGWTVTFAPGRALLPIDLAAQLLSAFYDQVMAYAAARMLADAAPMTVGCDIADGYLMLDFSVMNGAGLRGLEWKVVYWFAAYLQALARRGYTGLGRITFRNADGWACDVTLSLE